jgi:hypothetical protein
MSARRVNVFFKRCNMSMSPGMSLWKVTLFVV